MGNAKPNAAGSRTQVSSYPGKCSGPLSYRTVFNTHHRVWGWRRIHGGFEDDDVIMVEEKSEERSQKKEHKVEEVLNITCEEERRVTKVTSIHEV